MATTHIVTIKENYYCAYIPSARSQKYAFDEVRGEIKVSIPSVTADEAPVAFRLSDYHHRECGDTEIRWYQGQLWRRMTQNDGRCGGDLSDVKPDELPRVVGNVYGIPYGIARTRELLQKKLRESAKRYIIIDGAVWTVTGEPRYVVNTFGLGHNHGGTGLFVEEYYNQNIAASNYFSALDGDKAVAYANRVAERRGDTNSVGKFEKMIEVLITEAAPDSTTAGLLAIMATAKELEK